jgi:hypothetical protein
MITLNYNNFINGTGSFPGNASFGPEYIKDYVTLYSEVSNLNKSDPIITFSNFPANLKIVGNVINPPFSRVFIDIGYNDYIYLQNASGQWIDESDGFMAAYIPSLNRWGLGAPNGASPGVIHTGAGNSNSSILDIEWEEIAFDDQGENVGSPFNAQFGTGWGPWEGTYPDEPMIDYTVINNYTIRIETDIDTLPIPLRKLYLNFSGIS